MSIVLKVTPILGALMLLLAAATTRAQIIDPVKWALELEPAQVAPGGKVVAKVRATVQDGWHLYASTSPQGKPIALQFEVAENPAIESWQAWQPTPDRQYDPNFDMESQWYEHEAVFWVELQLEETVAPGAVEIEAKMRYGACDATQCLNPTRKSAIATLSITAGAPSEIAARPDGYEGMNIFAAPPPPAQTVTEAAAAMRSPAPSGGEIAPIDRGFLQFAALAFGFGLLAIFTPCVFPMIPIMMSYFVSTQDGETKASLVQATTFAVGVIALFTGMGALVSVILGPFGMQTLGSNVWVNLFIAIVFFAFGASLLGAFEITLPSGAMTKLNTMTQGSGLLPTLMMGLVFALASFACTGPFVGALLAGSVSGGLAWPIFGMLMFSAGLALPFFLLALFPAYLKRLPRAGGWMTRVKIAMAFPIIAAAFKYLSTVDLMYGWDLLSRELFLAIWVVLFVLDGLYLLGLLRLEDDPAEKVGLGRLSVGAASLILAVSLIPGMFGGHLGELEAYVPAAKEGLAFGGGGGGAQKAQWMKDDYPGALEKAQQSGRPLLISFTGYSCTNCKWMKANMFPKPEIRSELDRLVLLELYTDDPDDSITDANQKLQQERFQSVAVPFYALVDGDGATIATFTGRTRDVSAFQQFLQSGKSALTQAGVVGD